MSQRRIIPAIALTEPAKIGEVLTVLHHKFIVTQRITRTEYMRDMIESRARVAAAGQPIARRGTLNMETNEWTNLDQPPPECKYCYRVREVEK